ncbi:MAG: HTH domain-containing protein [Deltaproteobacteria bacterium]|nr:HTH domain-containing protein [Deltaproteobacteria bacterium]
MARDPQVTISEIAIELGITTRAVEKQISNLKESGRIERVGPDKGGHWKVKEN